MILEFPKLLAVNFLRRLPLAGIALQGFSTGKFLPTRYAKPQLTSLYVGENVATCCGLTMGFTRLADNDEVFTRVAEGAIQMRGEKVDNDSPCRNGPHEDQGDRRRRFRLQKDPGDEMGMLHSKRAR